MFSLKVFIFFTLKNVFAKGSKVFMVLCQQTEINNTDWLFICCFSVPQGQVIYNKPTYC